LRCAKGAGRTAERSGDHDNRLWRRGYQAARNRPKIDTPIGTYNPDWAFVTEREEKLYFVRETKSTLNSEERRTKENQKIACGRKHFDSLGVDYDVVTSLAEVAF
jgi:restriction endonuclease